MKTLFITLMTVLAAAQAEARTPITYLSAGLERFQIDPAHEERFGRVESGLVEVDLVKKKIRVSLYPRTNTRCMPQPEVVELPIFDIKKDSCNIAHYEARTPELFPGGLAETIDVADNTKNRCPTFVALSPTSVSYTTSRAVNPPFHASSHFEGPALVPGKPKAMPVARCR